MKTILRMNPASSVCTLSVVTMLMVMWVPICLGSAISPEDAKNHIGQTAEVRGVLEQVSTSKQGHVFLNFGGRYPNHIFTGFIRLPYVKEVGGLDFLRSLEGKEVTISGIIKDYKGKPEIVISSSVQIER